ncbi:MAG: sugar phosphate isomerase/epimerase [Anaerolineae bacterium]|nr:sugar phosphate isomerase/epimerase [Anaerolineae bacterium]
MQLAVTNHSFELLSLEGTLALAHHMGFGNVDIAGFHNRGRCSFEPEAILHNPQRQADILKSLLDKYELQAVDFFAQYGSHPGENAINDPEPAIRTMDETYIRGSAQFCQAAGIPGLTILPGIDHVRRSLAENLEASGKALARATEIANEYGIELRFEPHMGSVADTPERALTLIELSPYTKITLDYAHFILQYIPQDRIDKLIPYTGHVHVRQARFGKLQTSWDEGTINFQDIITQLTHAGFQGALAIEYVFSDWFDLNRNDVLSETIITKAALEGYI